MPPRKLKTNSDPQAAANRTKAQAVIEFNDAHSIRYNKSDVWKHFNVSRSTGYRTLAAAKRPPPDPDEPERRGRKRKITRDEQRKLEEYLELNDGVPTEPGAGEADVKPAFADRKPEVARPVGFDATHATDVRPVGHSNLPADIGARANYNDAGHSDSRRPDSAADVENSPAQPFHENNDSAPPQTVPDRPPSDEVDGTASAERDEEEAEAEAEAEGEGDEGGDRGGKGGAWTQIAKAAGVRKVHWRTVRRAIGSLDYLNCINCGKRWISGPVRNHRAEVARKLLLERPTAEQWRDVYFTGTWHLRLSPDGKISRMPKSGDRHCWECLPEVNRMPEKDVWRIHCWAMVGYGYKSAVVFYEGPTMPTGDMNQKVYIEQILEPHVKPLAQQLQQQQQHGQNSIQTPRRVTLFEENEPGFGPVESGQNRARNWKEAHGVSYLFNAPRSRDLNILEDCWSPVEDFIVNNHEHGNDRERVKELILKGWWETVSQERIDGLVDSMPARVSAVWNQAGGLTGYSAAPGQRVDGRAES